jgi:Ca-activated chloride channel family protein
MGNVLYNAATRQPIKMAMQHLDLVGRASAAGALLQVIHKFKAEGTAPVEALYTCQLPRNGVVRRFIVKGDGFEVESKLSPRAEARKEYEEGVQQGHLSVLSEASLDGLTTISIGQIRPDEEVTVTVEIVCGVEVRDQGFRFRFPFTLAPNYHSQAVASSNRVELPTSVFGDLILPEWKNAAKGGLHQVSFKVMVDPGGALDFVSSPSHRVLIRPNADGTAEVSLAGGNDVPNRDLVIDVNAKEATPVIYADTSLVAGTTPVATLPKDAPAWTVSVPSSKVPKAAAVARKVLFLLDRSGSMQGDRMAQARLATQACLSALEPTDEFGLISFSYTPEVFAPILAPATDANRKQAKLFLDRINASGGTELLAALTAATEVLSSSGDGDIFLITDGEVMETGTILEQMASTGIKVHVLGIGDASQDRFMASMSRRTGGVQRMVGVGEDVATQALDLFNAVKQPLQQNVKAVVELTDGKLQEHTVKTVWDRTAVLITDNGQNGRVLPKNILLYWDGGNTKVELPLHREAPDGLMALLWAGRQVEDLESALDQAGKGPKKVAIEKMLKEVSMTYSLASRVMSLSAVVKRIGDIANVPVNQQIIPVGMPSDMPQTQVGSTGALWSLNQAGVVSAAAFYSPCINVSTLSLGGGYSPPGVYCMLQDSSTTSLTGDVDYCDSDSLESCEEPTKGIIRGGGARLRQQAVKSKGGGMTKCCESLDAPPARRKLALRDNQDAFNAAAAATPKKAQNYSCSDIKVIGKIQSMIEELGKLEADGGAPGDTSEHRFYLTLVLALAALAADVDGGTSIYRAHLKKMAAFLEKHAPADFKDLPKITKALKGGTTKVNGNWSATYLPMCKRPGMYIPDAINLMLTEASI